MAVVRVVFFVIVAAVASLFTAGQDVAAAEPRPVSATVSPEAAVTVHVNLAFDPSITSTTIKAAAQHEAEEIWRVYGVELAWTAPDSPAALCVDAYVMRDRKRTADRATHAVLGNATVNSDPDSKGLIRISFDLIETLLEPKYGGSLLFYDHATSMVLGRVLAHEIGHVLLGAPGFHDEHGLMRATFFSDDLVRPDRASFKLTARSLLRLRARIASSFGAESGDSCALSRT